MVIDSARFMASPLSNLVDYLTEKICILNVKIVIVFLNMKVIRIIWSDINVYFAINIIQTKLMEN